MADDDAHLLSAKQRVVVSYALTGIAVLALAAVALVVLYALRWFVITFSGVIWPLAVAGILALLLRPIVRLFEDWLNLRRIPAIALLYLLVILVVLGFFWFVFVSFSDQVISAVEGLPGFLNETAKSISEEFPGLVELYESFMGEGSFDGLITTVKEALSASAASATKALQATGTGIIQIGATLAAIGIVPVYLFFFLETSHDLGEDVRKQMTFLKPGPRDDALFLMREFVNILVSFFRGQFVVALITGLMLATGFGLIGVRYGILLGFLLGLLNIIPYLGTIIGLAITLPVAYFQDGGGMIIPDGGIWMVAGVIAVFSIAQTIESNFVTPKIMGDRTGLHPMVVIVAIFFWGKALNGILGMILAIPLTAFIVIAWRLVTQKYLPDYSHLEETPDGREAREKATMREQ